MEKEEKFNEATRNRPSGDRPIDSRQLKADLAETIKELKNEKAWKKNDRNARTLFKSGKITTVLIALKKKAEIKTRQPEDLLILQVLKGRIEFNSTVQVETVKKGETLFFHEGIIYNILAKKESVVLLTVVQRGNELN